MKAYRAYGTNCNATAATPRQAAEAFFAQYPNKRKCSVIEGELDGHFFTVSYGRASEGKWPSSWKDVTKKVVADLPNEVSSHN